MKTSKKLLASFLLIFSLLIFVGCNNKNKTLARNLDNTITNLVYSVSSLDWADSDTLKSISNQNQNSSDQDTIYETEVINNQKQENNQNYQDSINGIHQINKLNNEQSLNSKFSQANNLHTENDDLKNFKTNIKTQNQLSQNQKNNQLFNNKNRSNINNKAYNNTNSFSKNYSINLANKNLISNENIKTISYSTSTIEDNTPKIQESITNLINERTNILLYINDLYKGNVDLSNEEITALNAYINIIKDNTSYLNSNKGLISNQLNQANDLATNNSNSSIINAYIIRANEAINTRLAKLDSSILAIQSICDIIKANLTKNSPYYNIDINTFNTNKNANTDLNNANNSEVCSINELNKQLQTTNSEILSKAQNSINNKNLNNETTIEKTIENYNQPQENNHLTENNLINQNSKTQENNLKSNSNIFDYEQQECDNICDNSNKCPETICENNCPECLDSCSCKNQNSFNTMNQEKLSKTIKNTLPTQTNTQAEIVDSPQEDNLSNEIEYISHTNNTQIIENQNDIKNININNKQNTKNETILLANTLGFIDKNYNKNKVKRTSTFINNDNKIKMIIDKNKATNTPFLK